jgi:hypothetical protein
MLTLVERPSTTQKIGLFARKNGKYTRPVVGDIIDFRIEDFLPDEFLKTNLAPNFVGRLPDIPEIGQINKYFIAITNSVSMATQQEVDHLAGVSSENAEQSLSSLFLAKGFVLLPHEPSSEFWRFTNAPWWVYPMVLDGYNGFIKAPLSPREELNEPSAEEADERIDEFEENRGKIQVVAPATLDEWALANVQESYIERLRRI